MSCYIDITVNNKQLVEDGCEYINKNHSGLSKEEQDKKFTEWWKKNLMEYVILGKELKFKRDND